MRQQLNSTINITCSSVPSCRNHSDGNARYMRIVEIIQRDLSRQKKTSFLQERKGPLPPLTQCPECLPVDETVNDES